MDQKAVIEGMKVFIAPYADFKYNSRRSGSVGVIRDEYESTLTGDKVFEVEFDEDGRLDLIRPEDIFPVRS